MAKLLCTITTRVYDNGTVEVSTEPYREPVDVDEIKAIATGAVSDQGFSGHLQESLRKVGENEERARIFGLGT
jgi:hypothetical protein